MINKVVYGSNTLIDLTNDTVNPMSLDEGVTAHDASGNIIIGTATRGLPVGFEYFQTNPNIQAGSIPFVGGLWDRTIYSDLWNWVQQQDGYLISEDEWQALAIANNGAVPYYSTGDGSTNFRVPALSIWVKGASSIEEIGDYLEDTLKSHKHDVTATTNEVGEHAHSASVDEVGGHTHTKGTMNITGKATSLISARAHTTDFDSLFSGALTPTNNGRLNTTASSSDTTGNDTLLDINLDASRSWTGETSENGNHTHIVTVNNNGNHTHTVTITENEFGEEETRPKTIVGVFCVIAFGYISSSGDISLNDVQSTLEGVQESIKALGEVVTISIQVTQPSTPTKVWIKPI